MLRALESVAVSAPTTIEATTVTTELENSNSASAAAAPSKPTPDDTPAKKDESIHADTSFPSRALNLAFLIGLAESKTINPDWAAHQVKTDYVLPQTSAGKTAFTDSPIGEANSAETNLFVSHAWQYTFGQLITSLSQWAKEQDQDPATTYCWIDLFSVNQHVSADVSQDEWAETFKNGIAKAGRFVLVLTPWSNPVPYTRAWCLWEVFNASKTGVPFSIALAEQEAKNLGDTIAKEPLSIVPALCEIQSKKASAQDPRDMTMISSWIQRPKGEGGAGGFTALDGLLLDMMREWLWNRSQQLLQERSPDQTWAAETSMLDFREAMAHVYDALGKYNESLALKEAVTKARKELLGAEHEDTLIGMINLAITYKNLGRYEDALALEEQVVEARKSKLGKTHPDTLVSMNNLADSYAGLGRFEDSLVLAKETVEGMKTTLGPEHPHTLSAMNSLANYYKNMGRLEDAVQLGVDVLQRRKEVLGDTHPDTLISMNDLASFYFGLDRHDESLKLHTEVLSIRTAALGIEHRDTIISMSNVAETLSLKGQHEEALAKFSEVVPLASSSLGAEHFLTKAIEGIRAKAVARASDGSQ